MARVVVYHGYYGCDTGCCGHTLEVDDPELQRKIGWGFNFFHPRYYGDDPVEMEKAAKKFAEDFIREELGEEHVADLDWENSVVIRD